MRTRRLLPVLVLAALGAACAEDGSIQDPTETTRSAWFLVDKKPYQVLRWPRSPIQERVVEDANDDGIADKIVIYDQQGRLRWAEADLDFDGDVDRWEYYGRGARVVKIGVSALGDGKPDEWVVPDEQGGIACRETDRNRDGRPDRFLWFEKGRLVRITEDSNGDGTADREVPVP